MGLLKTLVTEIPKEVRGTILLLSYRNRSLDDVIRKGVKVLPADAFCRTGRIPANDPAFDCVSMEDARLTAEKEPGYRLAVDSRRDPREMLKLQRDAKKILEYQLPSASDL